MSDIDLDKLAALAQAATPGPWAFPGIDSVAGGNLYDRDVTIAHMEWDAEPVDSPIRRTRTSNEADANGAFIAAANPDTILALVERVREAEARTGRYEASFHGMENRTFAAEHRADAAEARVAELEAFKRRLTEELVASDAERDRLRAGITTLADEWAKEAHEFVLASYADEIDEDVSMRRLLLGQRLASMQSSLHALLCSPTADTPREDKP